MDTSAASSVPHGQYAIMLQQLTELRGQLEHAAAQNHALAEQNRSLQAMYGSVKAELVESRKKYAEAQENYLATVTAKFEAERQSEAFLEHLKAQLNEKTKEFEVLRDKFSPQDIDYIRIKVQEELEVPHRNKVHVMEKEIDRHREQYYTMRRNYELVKAQSEMQIQNHMREIASLRDGHALEVKSMKKVIDNLRNSAYSPEHGEQLRAATAKVHELENKLRVVSQEAATLRSERDNAVVAVETARSRLDEMHLAQRTKATAGEAELHATRHQNASMLVEVEKKDSIITMLKQNVEELERQLTYFRSLANDREGQLAKERSDNDEQVAYVRSTYERQVSELEERNVLLQNKLRDREESLRRAQREANEMQLRAESLESEVRKSFFQQLVEAKQRAENLELELMDLKDSYRQSEMQLKAAIDQSLLECDRLRSESSRLSREKEVLHGHLRDQELKLESEKRVASDVKRAKEDALRLLKTRDSETLATRQALEQMSAELIELKESSARREQEYKKQWEYVQVEVQKRYEALGVSYKKTIEDCIKKGKAAVLRERKRADAYKSRAIDLHRKSKSFQVTTATS